MLINLWNGHPCPFLIWGRALVGNAGIICARTNLMLTENLNHRADVTETWS
ncbi:hypothetical protein NIES4071_96190 [Calothrix sp. NIES-4071]|nr:hypothetical protein NIES4071_96190 [Calothrix sp. NIES-4071]BAZ63884.1 hypothetical protein NIES4105_96120 [Calothrix sp. NIES-4105]